MKSNSEDINCSRCGVDYGSLIKVSGCIAKYGRVNNGDIICKECIISDHDQGKCDSKCTVKIATYPIILDMFFIKKVLGVFVKPPYTENHCCGICNHTSNIHCNGYCCSEYDQDEFKECQHVQCGCSDYSHILFDGIPIEKFYRKASSGKPKIVHVPLHKFFKSGVFPVNFVERFTLSCGGVFLTNSLCFSTVLKNCYNCRDLTYQHNYDHRVVYHPSGNPLVPKKNNQASEYSHICLKCNLKNDS